MDTVVLAGSEAGAPVFPRSPDTLFNLTARRVTSLAGAGAIDGSGLQYLDNPVRQKLLDLARKLKGGHEVPRRCSFFFFCFFGSSLWNIELASHHLPPLNQLVVAAEAGVCCAGARVGQCQRSHLQGCAADPQR